MTEENHEKTTVRLVGTGIRTRNLPNASLVRYHGASSLGQEKKLQVDIYWKELFRGATNLLGGGPDNIVRRSPLLSTRLDNNLQTVADGGFQIWGGHDVMKYCITCIYIEYKYSNYYLQSKITRRSFFFINQLIHRVMWVDSVCSFMRIHFPVDTQASAQNHS